MADENRKIEIEIAATGGEAAANEIKKPADAIDRTSQTTRKLEEAGTGLEKSSKAAAVANSELASSSNTVTASSASMRMGLQNVGYQVQDFAVQVSSGTAASRAFAQQAPQLLSAFGPWGVGLGTVVALGAPLVAQLFEQADGAEKAASAMSEATGKTIELAKASELAATRESERSEKADAMAESLRQITTAQYQYNESLKGEIELLKERQGAENEIAKAKGDLEIEAATGDPLKQEQVRNRLRREDQDRQQRQISDEVTLKGDLLGRLGKQQDEVSSSGRAEAERLKREAEAVAAQALEAEQAKVMAKGRVDYFKDAAERSDISPKEKRANLKEASAAEARVAELEEESKALRAREKQIREGAGEAEKSTSSEVQRLQKEMQSLADSIRKLETKSTTNAEVFDAQNAAGQLREDRIAKDQAQRQKEKADRESGRQQRDAGKNDAFGVRRENSEAKIGEDAVKLLPDGVREEFRRSVEKAARGLQDGDQGGEVKELISLMNHLAGAVRGKDAKTEAALAELRRSVSTLEYQIKNNRR